MKLTVSTAVSERPVEEKGLLGWVNQEATKLLRQLRTFANFRGVEKVVGNTTGDGAYTTLWTSDVMPTDAVWHLTADTTGIASSGVFQGWGAPRAYTFRSSGGTLAQIGVTGVYTHESAVALDVRFQISGRTIEFQARDDGTSPMRWSAVIHIHEVLPA